MKAFLVLTALALGATTLAACKSSNSVQACAACDQAKSKNGWCDSCAMGYKPDGTTTKCKSCHAGVTGQTVWCGSCKKGYVNGKATKCEGCVTAAQSKGKCAT